MSAKALRRSLLAALLALIVVAGPAAAHAKAPDTAAADAPAEAPTPWSKGVPQASQTKAQALYATGNDLYGNKEYGKALEKYRAAVALWDHPSIRFNMVVAYLDLGEYVRASQSLERALRFGQGPLSSANFAEAQRFKGMLRALVATVSVRSKPGNAQLELDGKPIKAGEQRAVAAGAHVAVARKPGYVDTSVKLTAKGGELTVVDVVLVPQMRSTTVYPYAEYVPYVVVGAGLLVGAAGLPMWFVGDGLVNEHDTWARENCANDSGCSKAEQDAGKGPLKDEGYALRDASYAMFALGGAAVVAGAILFVLNQPEVVKEPVVPQVSVTPGLGGGSLSIRF